MSASSSTTRPVPRTDPRGVDGRPVIPRTTSIDSTVSSASSASQKPPGGGAASYRASTDSAAGPQDAAAVIAAAGSPDAAVQKLLSDKAQAASHNAQLWRLVEKQRAMILGLNKDLEKSLKEKERYRKKLKDHLLLAHAAGADPRDPGASPALPAEKSMAAIARGLRDDASGSGGAGGRKVSDASDVASVVYGRSDTPQNSDKQAPSSSASSGAPTTPPSAASSSGAPTRDPEPEPEPEPAAGAAAPPAPARAERKTPAPIAVAGRVSTTPQTSPKTVDAHTSPGSFGRLTTSVPSPPQAGVSSPKSGTRKAPPAPLQLSPTPVTAHNAAAVVEHSDSEYEDDPESARAEQMMRGRRKTREEDDREREAVAQQELEHRSRSKKSKSKSQSAPTGPVPAPVPTAADPRDPVVPAASFDPTADPAAILRHRAVSDAAGLRSQGGGGGTAPPPALLSPGLPMSPRPSDKPLNSPMPRAPHNKTLNSLPMSPRGMAGVPLSPRAPRQALPRPPQTPLTFTSPHLARADAYHQQQQLAQAPPPSIADMMLKLPSDHSPERGRPSTSSDPLPKSPGEVYRGLVTEQYPDFLLPPNALPSIYVKTSSPRMKPSRHSVIMPKPSDDSPVLTLAVHERSDQKQLWRVEKTVAALVLLDAQVKAVCPFRDRLPDKAVFTGHAPVKIDTRRAAVDAYFNRMLDAIHNDTAATVVCRFLSTDALGADMGDSSSHDAADSRPDTPLSKLRPQRTGYLTKRGKNFGGWKARYFVLDGPHLKYFEAPGGPHLGSIKLPNAQIGKQSAQAPGAPDDEDNQYRHAFLILEPKKKDSSSLVRHVLCAESDEERDAWVEALLQYVALADDTDEPAAAPAAKGGGGGGLSFPRAALDMGGSRTPRSQKSMSDVRTPSQSTTESSHAGSDPLRGMNYNDTVAGEAPIMGPSATPRKAGGTPSPPHDAHFGSAAPPDPAPAPAPVSAPSHPTISGPTNLQVISNAGDWGMKPPPTPQGLAKDKKRSMFAAFRGRSSSEIVPTLQSPGLAPPPEQSRPTGMRAVFGVPLAEAVEYAHPADATTELPAVVYRCIEYLTAKNAIAEEGIFRLSGSNTVIKSLKDRFNTEGDVPLTAEDHYYDIHAVASLLKLYLRELPVSILTRELHLEFLACLELHGKEKVVALNSLVHRLPRPNLALLRALSEFLLSIVKNADVNKMNVRNVGIVFAPTLNVPAPLISSFVDDQRTIFGSPIEDAESPISATEVSAPALPTDLRSPRKQMFSDLPTPGYNQTTFQSFGGAPHGDTGFTPMQPSYAAYQMAPQGEGGFGSLNDALRSPTVYNTAANGTPTPRDMKAKRRESAMMLLHPGHPEKKPSLSKLREESPHF